MRLKLRIRLAKRDRSATVHSAMIEKPRPADGAMIKANTVAVWGATPAGSTHVQEGLNGSQEAFDRSRQIRGRDELRWIAELIPFREFAGRDLLEIGCGAGFDAYEFERSGARYVGIDLVPSNVELTLRHLRYHGYDPRVLVADAERLPFDDTAFDVVFSNGVLHHTPDIARALEEARRVLKPGGALYISLYHRMSAFYWLTLFLEHHILRGGYRHRSFKDRLAMIEYSSSTARPLVNTYTKEEVRRLLVACGFEVRHIWVRKLRPEDLPTLPFIVKLWPRIPQQWLDAIGRRFGWYVIASAVRRPE
jgi:SAM-dependent methyltransferase